MPFSLALGDIFSFPSVSPRHLSTSRCPSWPRRPSRFHAVVQPRAHALRVPAAPLLTRNSRSSAALKGRFAPQERLTGRVSIPASCTGMRGNVPQSISSVGKETDSRTGMDMFYDVPAVHMLPAPSEPLTRPVSLPVGPGVAPSVLRHFGRLCQSQCVVNLGSGDRAFALLCVFQSISLLLPGDHSQGREPGV